MIRRIVKLSLKETEIEKYKSLFSQSKGKILGFGGCHHVESWQNIEPDNIFFTFSIWDDEDALDKYRHSDLFRGIWSVLKPCFNERAEAWSVELLED